MPEVWVILLRCSENQENFCRKLIVAAQRKGSCQDVANVCIDLQVHCYSVIIAGFFILKKVRQGMCLLAFIPSQLHADEQWDFNNVKLRPGNLTSKSCNLLCFDSVKPHMFNFVYNMFLSRKQIKKSHILLTMYTWTLFIENVLWVNTSFMKLSRKSISVVFWHDTGVHISSL